MTVHSSFLVRCWLEPGVESAQAKMYHIEHVQTGEQFRTPDFAAAGEWIHAINLKYLATLVAPDEEA